MDYTNVCQGWIYYIKNKINGKMYIGQTIDFRRRERQHFSESENCPLLLKAFNKHGKENFEMTPLLCLTFVNEEVRRLALNTLEQFYIKKYNTYNHGYNVTKGAMGHQGYSPSEDTVKKIKEHNAEWWSKEENKEFHRSTLPKKPILQYDRYGNFIQEYSSLTIAVEQFDSQWSALQAVSESARKKKGCIYGFQWRYKEGNTIPMNIGEYLHKSSKPVYHYTQDGILIKAYPDAGYASRELGISRKYIISAVRWNTYHPNSKKMRDYWSREAPVA